MKKYVFLLFLILCSCKSINYNDVNPAIVPNKNLLPALESVVDVSNLEATYTAGGYSGTANNVGTGFGTGYGAGWMQTTAINGTNYKDARVNDIINIFNKDVKENITNPYGEKKGYIFLKLGYRGEDSSFILPITSALSLFTLNFVGYPGNKVTQSLEVEVEILNNKKELIKRYVENVNDYGYVAMYWGYSGQTIRRKVAADNIKQALDKIKNRINDDAVVIKKSLN